MARRTARQNLAAAQLALNQARARVDQLASDSRHKRRTHPDLPQAQQEQQEARAKFTAALDEYNKTQRRPRYTAPR